MLVRERCDYCDGTGLLDDTCLPGPIECFQCHGRKFVWLSIVNEGGAP